MPLFRRGKQADEFDDTDETEDTAEGEFEETSAEDDEPEEPEELPSEGLSDRSEGPWDVSELTEEQVEQRLDIGGLRLLIPEGVEVRIDIDQQTHQVQIVNLVRNEEVMQISCFAAPRTEGIWGEVRAEIRDSILGGGGQATEGDGPFGTVLTARIPTDQPGMLAPARFIGVNGPRWFLRALTTGPLAANGMDDPLLIAALKGVAVVRGPDAMAPRDPLPLRLPKEAMDGAAAAQAQAQAEAEAAAAAESGEKSPLTLPERGPEITETR